MIAQNSEVYNPPTYLFSLYTYMEKDLCRGVVYFTVLCDHPCLVSLLFAVLVSLHPVTFSNVFYYFKYRNKAEKNKNFNGSQTRTHCACMSHTKKVQTTSPDWKLVEM